MLIEFVNWLDSTFGAETLNRLFDYITFRAGSAIILSLLISTVIGQWIIKYLQKQQISDENRKLGLAGENLKAGTPTMGGVIIILATLVPALLFARLDNVYIILIVLATVWMAVIGFVDDYIKVYQKNKAGLKGKFKIMGQVGLGLIIALTMIFSDGIVVRMEVEKATGFGLSQEDQIGETIELTQADGSTVVKADYKTSLTNVPFLKGNRLDYAWLVPMRKSAAKNWVWIIFVPLVIIVTSAVSNGANLTDGLDGLATGVSGIIVVTLGILAYVSGNAITANYLNILHLPGTGELVIFSASLVGACIGFLWYNSFPAQVFMGDTGSLTLGGIIAALGILLRKELLIPILCGIFLIESLSVILQVTYFKYTKKKYGEGRRVFKMAPIHHHFQKQGMHEVKIVNRFWIVGILLAVITIITLKVR